MAAHLGGVFGEFDGAARGIGLDGGFAKRFGGCLGIDHDLLVAGQVNHEVGAVAFAAVRRHLFGKIAMLGKAGKFDDATELDFTPRAGGAGGAEGGGETAGFGLEAQLRGLQRFELLAELAVGAGPCLFQVGDLTVDFFERDLERLDKGVDCLLAGGEIALGFFLELAEGLLGKLEKVVAVGAECGGGEGGEFGLEALVGGAQLGETRLGTGVLGGELGLHGGVLRLEVGVGGADGGELGVEPGGFVGARAEPLDKGGLTVLKEEPGDRGGDQRSSESDQCKIHVNIV